LTKDLLDMVPIPLLCFMNELFFYSLDILNDVLNDED